MSSTNSEIDSGAETSKQRRELLLKVYGAALDEYRFNVQLTWDRTKFYLGLSFTAIAAGIGLMRLATDSKQVSAFISMYFVVLIAVSALGLRTAINGKRYYRQAILTKTLVERELGLYAQLPGFEGRDFHLGIAVTPGQRDLRRTLFAHEKKLQENAARWSVVDMVYVAFSALVAIESFGAIFNLCNAMSR